MRCFRQILLISLFILLLSASRQTPSVVQEKKLTGNITENEDLYLPEGLEATLWAESPMLYNPTNMDVDSKGRIWITEAVNYRNYNNDSTKALHHPLGDRVMILEDSDGDGKADASKIFVQDKDLVAPVGIAVIGNKIIVSCSPNLIVYTDDNGDDIPDKKEILLTGFGGIDHDHSLHAVYAGPDGQWYFTAGNAGPHVVKDKSGFTLRAGSIYTGGSPYNMKNTGNLKSDDGRTWVGGVALRVNSDGTGLKVMGHNFRNAYEVIPDSYGNLWQNDNDDQVVTCRTTWLMEGGNAGYFSADGTRYWQADQRPGQDIFTAHWHQEDPGVMPAGDRSGAGAPTGIVLNESDALGKEYLGMLLSADAGRNVIFGYHPVVQASGYSLGKRKNFITSLKEDNTGYVWNDAAQNNNKEKWFRPSDVTIGTDGAIYIADWYDPVVGGHQMLDQKGYGRIYRITPKNKKLVTPKIDLGTIEGQIEALKSPAINVRNAGFEKLENGGEAAFEQVKSLLNNSNRFIKARSIWLLSQMGGKGKSAVEACLADPDELMRATAYRALRQVSADIFPYAQKSAIDPSPFVRREVAISLRDLPYEKTKPILLQLIKNYNGQDRWYLETLGANLEGHESDIYPEIIKIWSGGKPAPAWNRQMSSLAWRLHPAEAVNDLVARATNPALPKKDREAALTALAFVNNKMAADHMVTLSRSGMPDVAAMAKYWLSFRQGNDWLKLLDWSKLSFNTGYERKLALMKVKQSIILDGSLALQERRGRANEMAADSIGGQLLIGLAASKKLPKDLVPHIEERIFKNPNAAVRVQAGDYFKRPGTAIKYSIQEISKLKGDERKGQAVFDSRCGSCHKAGNQGRAIGPDLTTIGQKLDKTALLDAIINPGAAIVFGYEPWLINTKDGTSVYGFIVSENPESIVIKDLAGQHHTIATGKIATKEKQRKTVMPEPVDNELNQQQLADVVKFLLTLKNK